MGRAALLLAVLSCAMLAFVAGLAAQAPSPSHATDASLNPPLDRVVAVVNNKVVLASDIDREMRVGVLDPNQVGIYHPSRARSLERLISRQLIEQQIAEQGDPDQAAEQDPDIDQQLAARLLEVRKVLPACASQNCDTDAGWTKFLASHGLTPTVVESYLRHQIGVLGFIEQRFRQGIRISPPEIENFYRKILLPQYPDRTKAPSLESVSPRIQEVLLEQQVNGLLDDWLTALRKEGEVEILDPEMELALKPFLDHAAQPKPPAGSAQIPVPPPTPPDPALKLGGKGSVHD